MRRCLVAVCVSALLLAGGGFSAHAQTERYGYHECTIYSLPACPGANTVIDAVTNTERTAAIPVLAGRAGKAPAAVAIDLNNVCRWVDNAAANTTGTDLFVPFKTDVEWRAFVSAVESPGSIASKYASTARCARPGDTDIPANDPADPPRDGSMLCYDLNHNLLADTLPFTVVAYGRVGDVRVVSPVGMSFTCYDAQGHGPWIKTVTQATLGGLSADRNGGSSSSRSNSDWEVTSVTYNGTPPQPVNGVCGSTVNGQSVSSAPSGAELCDTGVPTAVSGSGPWTWTCQGSNGGTDSGTCTANSVPKTCPAAVAGGSPLSGAFSVYYPGVTGQIGIYPTGGDGVYATYFNGWCSWFSIFGESRSMSGRQPLYLSNPNFYNFVQCITTTYARVNLVGYANCKPLGSVSGNAASPLKVNLGNSNAKMNSATPTAFLLTLQDGRSLEGHVKGGLNADEGWLMVRRTNAPLVFDNGALNADNWFGDRDHRSLNGYTDLAETFGAFVTKDEFGQRCLPLHVLTDAEKSAKTAEAAASNDVKITDPSFDLRIVDAGNAEHFASDYFDRIYVDYRNVVEGDAPDGKNGDNIILERGMVRTLQGENHGAIDQWFVLDIPADYSNPGHPTQSKVWPAGTAPR